jgi:peptide/nickel transport system ATP-binding protein
MTTPLLEVDAVSVTMSTHDGDRRILDGVSLAVEPGNVVGVVGESGSGKTITALAVADLLPPGARVDGLIALEGRSLLELDQSERDKLRGSGIAMVFQDPMSSLNPVISVKRQMVSVLSVHRGHSRKKALETARALLMQVGLTDTERVLKSYPHELSGGMCQRVMIALALACRPRLLIADEPTTALDVTVQAEIIALLQRLAVEENLSILFISHDLGVVSKLCSRIVVMYAGQVVETGTTAEILSSPAHPYTRALLNCIPELDQVGVLRSGIPVLLRRPGVLRWAAASATGASSPRTDASCRRPSSR